MPLPIITTLYELTPTTHMFATTLTAKLADSWAWYVSRGAGILAAVLLVLLLASGIGLLTGLTYRIFEPLRAWSVHRAMGIALVFSLVLHIFSLPFDKYVSFSVIDLLVPFASDFTPVTLFGVHLGSLYIALGIIALYATIAIVLTSIYWIQTKSRIWHLVHFLSYFVIILVFVHGLFIGTDMKSIFGKVVWIGGAVILLILTIRRIGRAGATNVD